jgi:hypothetical protein
MLDAAAACYPIYIYIYMNYIHINTQTHTCLRSYGVRAITIICTITILYTMPYQPTMHKVQSAIALALAYVRKNSNPKACD